MRSVPTIVHAVLAQLVRRRATEELTEAVFHSQIERLTRQELEPKGLTLLHRELPGGRTRFLVRNMMTKQVSGMFDFLPDGTEPEESGADAQAS